MRAAGIGAATVATLFAAVTAGGTAWAQEPYMPQTVSQAQMNAAGNAQKPKPAADAKKPQASAAPAQTATRTVSAPVSAPAATCTGPSQVFLLKGLADVFSSGMDALAVKLARQGIPARVASHASSDTLADEVIACYRAGVRTPIIIAGHSLGADAAVSMSQRLNDAKVPVSLVITFGPVGFPRVMGNVTRAVNYYQSNSSWRGQILKGPGFHGSLANVDLDKAADINHFNIEKADRIQAEAINRIAAAIGGGTRKAPPAAPAAAAADSAAMKNSPASPEGATAAGPAAPAEQN